MHVDTNIILGLQKASTFVKIFSYYIALDLISAKFCVDVSHIFPLCGFYPLWISILEKNVKYKRQISFYIIFY